MFSEESSRQGVSSTKQGVFQGAPVLFLYDGALEERSCLGLGWAHGLVCSGAGFWFLTGVNAEEKCLLSSISQKRELGMERFT